jgi:hypothetical protein
MSNNKPREVRPQRSKGEHNSDLHRTEMGLRIEAALPDSVKGLVRHVELSGMCGSKVTIYFEAHRRDDAVHLMRDLDPLPLTMYQSTNRRKVIWCAAAGEPRMVVASRESIAPFTFSVNQGYNYGPKVRLNWVTRVGDIFAMVEVDIQKDPAFFTLERNTAMLPSMVRWKWERSAGFPQSASKWGLWGHWMMNKGQDDAACTCYWPLHKLGQGANDAPFVAALALLLDSSSKWEGHKHEKT